jgi:hypothetical protein
MHPGWFVSDMVFTLIDVKKTLPKTGRELTAKQKESNRKENSDRNRSEHLSRHLSNTSTFTYNYTLNKLKKKERNEPVVPKHHRSNRLRLLGL